MFSISKLVAPQLLRASVRAPRIARLTRSISNDPKEVFTDLSNEGDAARDVIFKYTWGTWLKNDEAEKRKRYTKFSLTGLQSVLKDLYEQGRTETEGVVPPKASDKNYTSFPHNLSVSSTGSLNPGEDMHIKQLVSIHEGKHNRIYKVETNAGKDFVLRIPYPIDTEYAITKRIQSEVATMDFADLKLKINVPKVYAYASDKSNPLNSPFILMELIEGDTLMKQWAPMTPRTDPKHKDIIRLVVDPLSDLQAKLAEVEFNQFGSLYFTADARDKSGLKEPYEGETEEALKGRWYIGESTERVFWRNKPLLRKNQFQPLVGPWDAGKPLDIVKSVADIELENARTKLALVEADAAGVKESKEELKQQIETFTNLETLAPVMMDTKSESVKNVDALFAPRLAHTDLDPLNVLICKKTGEHVFLDFESATIKPLIFQSTPRFVAFEDSPKVYEFEIDEEKYKAMDEAEKYYYDFAIARTRNEVIWDLNLGNTFTKLGSEGSPVFKRLRAPYIAAIERRTANETALIDRRIYELMLQWKQFAEHKFVTVQEFPVPLEEKKFERHGKELEKYYDELSTVPFAVTGGWVPQDLFDSLYSQGVIKKLDNGDYEVVQEPAAGSAPDS
ncbi:CYFA0S02e01530g1_1 [Cyberlindnera fabianii]|uniref:Altered inheritance of mitochondria protein 9, mitochondrial n=1 Tax=Cyberlindnera fabianii TaxID=36022 RepID=A0A061ALK1_CYBFA|nr:Altered inheritance of mitochondria protein 9, mitochondrial [Cyberlindnera fabianii]CDR38425.1 CYFA0S02e01530g1_1 [Cyberlindnera fabianii]